MDMILSGKPADMKLIAELAKKLKISASPISPEAMETMEDTYLVKRMEESLAGGMADTDQVLRELGLKQ